ncbi:phage tail tube protein [Methylobacillus flagellatus]|uniref:phage tail tube protein n=1 Tax=Methylobacillus flagellatus TaxID=405 RepID=UPI0010F9E62B|nr:phage tail tube protein [Methylobacillus flagellatus]
MKKMRNVLMLAKIQPTAGTDPVPAAATNAILCKVSNPKPLMAEFVQRNLDRPYFGNKGSVLAAQHAEFDIEVELQGSGAPGAAPAWGVLLRACAAAETITADTSVKYNRITNILEAVALYWFLDGIRFIALGCRGNPSFTVNAKGIPIISFKMIGLYGTPTDQTMPTDADFSGFKQALAVNKQNTPSFNLHGYAACLESLSIDFGNDVQYRNLVNCESVEVVDSLMTGSAVIELPSIATKNYFAQISTEVLGPLTLVHGTQAGYIVTLTAPKVKIKDISMSESQGIAMANLTLDFEPDEGNDELELLLT